jgi:uncharacterized protein (DUF58 family)
MNNSPISTPETQVEDQMPEPIADVFGKADAFFEPEIVKSQMVFTPRFWLLMAIGIPISGLGLAAGIVWVFPVFNILSIFFALLTFQIGPNASYLRFRRRMDAVLSVRGRNRIRIEIESENPQFLSGRIRDEFPSTHFAEGNESKFKVSPGEEFKFEYILTPPERGDAFFRATFLRLTCPLGLVEKQIQLNTEQLVKVYPNLLALREFQLLNQQGRLREAGVRKSRMRGIGTEFESLREYSLGDDYRKIDWKATARRGKPIVRSYEVERNQAVMICIDCGRHMMAEIDGVRKLDLVLDSVLMLMQSALSAGDNVGILAYGADVIRYIPPKKGHRQLGVLLNAIHDLVGEPIESDPVRAFAYLQSRHKRRSLLINFTSIEDRDRGKEVLTSFGPLARSHVSLIGNIADPKFREILRQIPQESVELFQYASAHYLSEERKQGARVLTSAGIHVLDSEPQDLASDLVNFYLDVKSKGKL